MRTLCLALVILLGGCSLVVDNELSDRMGMDAGPTGETCTTDEQCVSFDPFNCNRVCGDSGRCEDGDTPDGVACGMTGTEICVGETCVTRECGDGFVDRSAMPPEFCDDGNDVDTDSCNNNCTRSCVPPARPNCDDGDPCNGMEMCIMAMGYCRASPALDDGTACNVGGVDGECYLGVCETD